MKIKLLIILILSNIILIAKIPQIVESRKNNLNIYTDSKETENMGYGNWYPSEDGEYLIIKNFIQKGNIVFDAGAHVGEWSELALKHTNNNCNLYSFEPVPHFFNKLLAAVGNNSKCYNAALGKAEMKTVMNYYYEESEGCSSLFDRKVLDTIPVKKIDINVTCLDKFCIQNQIDHIDFVKIDVEGCEWDVLQGANNLISNKKINFIQFEYGGTFPDANITLYQIYTYFINKEYSIFRITADGLVYIPQWRNELENYHLCNYLAVLNS